MMILSLLVFILIILALLYNLLCLACVLDFFRGQAAHESEAGEMNDLPAVSVLKPMKGLDDRCAENLRGFCAQDYPCHEVLFGFRDPDDPAVAVAESIAKSASCDARVVIRAQGSGPNQKVLNLKALADNSRYGMFALSDSDMAVDTGYLRRIVSEFKDGDRIGIVTSLYKISEPLSIGSALESQRIALDFIPSVLVARRLEGVTFGLGASILVSREAIREIGGFEGIADYLADDYQIGYRLWKKGYKNIISRYVMENQVGRMSIGSHMAHQVRWARTYRASRPWGFVGYGITHAFAFSVFLLCIRPDPVSLFVAGLVLAVRYVIALVMYRKVIRMKRWLKYLVLLPLNDLIGFFVWLWSLAGTRVLWRGARYRITADGRMATVPAGRNE